MTKIVNLPPPPRKARRHKNHILFVSPKFPVNHNYDEGTTSVTFPGQVYQAACEASPMGSDIEVWIWKAVLEKAERSSQEARDDVRNLQGKLHEIAYGKVR